jgi:hypothetical protein
VRFSDTISMNQGITTSLLQQTNRLLSTSFVLSLHTARMASSCNNNTIHVPGPRAPLQLWGRGVGHDGHDDAEAVVASSLPAVPAGEHGHERVVPHGHPVGDRCLTNGNETTFIFDYTIVHPYTGKGQPKPNVIKAAYNSKFAKNSRSRVSHPGHAICPLSCQHLWQCRL